MKLSLCVTVFCFSVFLLCSVFSVYALDAVVPGEFIIEPSTLICLGFEWKIEGDDNRNAAVSVSYRKTGSTTWSEGLPLFRMGDEEISGHDQDWLYTVPDMLAGSIFDLDPDTEYECRFVLSDPDGVQGEAVKTVKVSTRGEPKPYDGGRVFHVYPLDYEGTREEPSFTGLKEAYFGAGGTGDWQVVPDPRVEAGDIILMHAGLYKANRLEYAHELGLDFHGAYILTKSGTPDRPIVIKAAGDGEVIFDGDGSYRLFDVMAADYTYFEGLTIRNTEIAFYTGLKDVLGCSGLTVKNCRIEDVGIAVMNHYAGSKNFYIADNVMIGRHDRNRVHGWTGTYVRRGGEPMPLNSYYAVKVYGQGHVVCYNSIAYFHDGVCVCTHGFPEEPQDEKCVSIDIYNNDIFLMSDDFIETDGGIHNIRVFRNRGVNSAHSAMSAQPTFGGPIYFIRNVLYNVPGGTALKFTVRPSGILLYHNTFCAEWTWGMSSNVHLRNNLFLGKNSRNTAIINTGTYTSYSSFDYNGYRLNDDTEYSFVWKAPADGKLIDYSVDSQRGQRYATLEDFRNGAGQEQHGVLVDYNIFMNVSHPDAEQLEKVYPVEGMDFRLRPGNAAVDAGLRLPNINDGFSGKAPDLGAYEAGATVYHYGPRD